MRLHESSTGPTTAEVYINNALFFAACTLSRDFECLLGNWVSVEILRHWRVFHNDAGLCRGGDPMQHRLGYGVSRS